MVLFDEDSPFFFPKFQTQVRVVRKDGNVDSKVSDLWSITFSTLMELLDGYGDLLTDRVIRGLNRALSSHSQKRCLGQTLAESGVGAFKQSSVLAGLYAIFTPYLTILLVPVL